MIDNRFINCDVCETTINLRSQIGYFDIPFNLHCPICSTHIYGKLIINQEQIGLKLELVNAHIKNREISLKEKYYCAELSAEFPTKKMYMSSMCHPFLEILCYMELVQNSQKHITIQWNLLNILEVDGKN